MSGTLAALAIAPVKPPSSSLFYLAAYGIAIVGAFAIQPLVPDAGGEAWHLSRWAGLGKRAPLLAGVFALSLIAFAGIPLTSGFTGKFAVFQAAAAGGATPLVIIGVISSAIIAGPGVAGSRQSCHECRRGRSVSR